MNLPPLDIAPDGMIITSSSAGKFLGFTRDKFHGYLWKTGTQVTISLAISYFPGQGHFANVIKRLHRYSYDIFVPTPSAEMFRILTKHGFQHHFEYDNYFEEHIYGLKLEASRFDMIPSAPTAATSWNDFDDPRNSTYGRIHLLEGVHPMCGVAHHGMAESRKTTIESYTKNDRRCVKCMKYLQKMKESLRKSDFIFRQSSNFPTHPADVGFVLRS